MLSRGAKSTTFVHHAPCPRCHSRDNVGVYSDGSEWCFGGCGYYKPPQGIRQYLWDKNNKGVDDPSVGFDTSAFGPLPARGQAITWLKQYDITDEEVKSYRLMWDDERKWLLFPFFGKNDAIEVAAIRNFSGIGSKAITYGSKANLYPYTPNPGKAVVLVEDCVSAIKVARVTPAMPLLGSYVDLDLFPGLLKDYPRVIVWLDRDKAVSGRRTVMRANALWGGVRQIITPKDPKFYSTIEISERITNA